MSEEINYSERYDLLLNIQPNYGVDRVKRPVKFSYIGLEIEIAVNFERERYTFIRTLLKKIKRALANNGYFVKDNTIIGDYSFEIVLDPLPIKKIKKFYSTLMKIIRFSDGSLSFDKEHNCGLHMNFNAYDIEDKEEAHQRLLLLQKEKDDYFEENVYKRTIYNFTYEKYLYFQRNVSDKYIGVNYLNKRLVEVRNLKVGLSANKLEFIMTELIHALFLKNLGLSETTNSMSFRKIWSSAFSNANANIIKKSIDNELIVIKLTENGPEILDVDKDISALVSDVASIRSNDEAPLVLDIDEEIISSEMEVINNG